MFDSKDNSPISLVRIAINFDNTLESKELAFYLKNLGYDVALNMMQSHGKDSKTYISVAQEINDWNVYDILYFVDSRKYVTRKHRRYI